MWAQERKREERKGAREVHCPLSVIFRLHSGQGWNSVYWTPWCWRSEARHFLYTWPTDTINIQAARHWYTCPRANKQILVRTRAADERFVSRGCVNAERKRRKKLKDNQREIQTVCRWQKDTLVPCVKFSSNFDGVQRSKRKLNPSVVYQPDHLHLLFHTHTGTKMRSHVVWFKIEWIYL